MTTTSTKLGVRYPNSGADSSDFVAIFAALVGDIDALGGISGIFTTTQRDALAGANLWAGRLIYNTTTARLEAYTTSWQPLRTADLATAAGDMFYATAAGILARLAKDTDGKFLSLVAGLPAWATIPTPTTATAKITTTETTSSATYTDLATGGPAVSLTTSTTALVLIHSGLQNDTNADGAYVGVAVTGASAVSPADSDALFLGNPTGAAVASMLAAGAIYLTGLTPGSNTFTLKYKRNLGGTASFFNRRITVIAL